MDNITRERLVRFYKGAKNRDEGLDIWNIYKNPSQSKEGLFRRYWSEYCKDIGDDIRIFAHNTSGFFVIYRANGEDVVLTPRWKIHYKDNNDRLMGLEISVQRWNKDLKCYINIPSYC